MKRIISAVVCATALTFGSVAQASDTECTEETGTIITELVELNGGLSGGDFDLLIAAVLATINDVNLFEILTDEDRTVTLFAPTNEAFLNTAVALNSAGVIDLTGVDTTSTIEVINALVDEENGLGTAAVIKVLAYHVSPGNRTSKYVSKRDGKTIRMLNKQFVDVDGFTINNSPIDVAGERFDIQACNGLIHVIEGEVLVPDLSSKR